MCRNRKQPNYYIAIGMLISTTFYFLREAPVSYTHLDVYKRQGLDTLVVHAVNDEY